MREAVIVEALRTPIGKGKHGSKGALSAFHPGHLLAKIQEAVVERAANGGNVLAMHRVGVLPEEPDAPPSSADCTTVGSS